MTSRCCWFIQPAIATRTNRSGCCSAGMVSRLPEAGFIGGLAPARSEVQPSIKNRRSCGVDRVCGLYGGATPAAVLVGTDGLIRSALAVGAPAIEQLALSCAKSGPPGVIADVAATSDTTTDVAVKGDRRSNEGPTPSA